MKIEYEEEQTGPFPLDGIKVVEYGVYHAGPGAGAILGDLGADIVKVETIDGDSYRTWLNVANLSLEGPGGTSVLFEVTNRNKKNIALDIKTEEGRDVFERLIKKADVFLTNLRKTTIAKLKIDYAAISKINPKIIFASVSGYGTDGPMQDTGAFDPMGQACSGLMFATGIETPTPLNVGILDQATAITLSHAIITALLTRERQGISQEVHVSLYGTALWLQHINLMLNNSIGTNPEIPVDRSRHSPLRNTFCCGDGKWMICTHHPEEKYWAVFCDVMGVAELTKDSNFTDKSGRPSNYEELIPIFDRIFATKSRDEWMKDFTANRLMFVPVQNIADVEKDLQAQKNDYVRPGQYPNYGKINVPGYPIHFSKCQAGIRQSASSIGEQTDEIMRNLGYNAEAIDQFKLNGVIK